MNTKEQFNTYTKKLATIDYGKDGPTPIHLVEECVNAIPVDWSNPNLRFIDRCFGFGTFLYFAKLKLLKYHNESHILNNMLYGIEIEPFRYTLTKKKLEIKNLYLGDSLNPTNKIKEILNMDFDVELGNFPYQDASKASKNSGLWQKFLKTMVAPIGCFINPISWMSGSTLQKPELLKKMVNNLVWLNLNTKKYFPTTASTFCHFILDLNGSKETEVVQGGVTETLNLKDLKVVPKILNSSTIAIVNKFLFSDHPKLGFSTKMRVTPSGKGNYKIYHSDVKIINNEVDAKNSGIPKICLNKSGYLNPKVTKLGTSQNVYWAPLEDEDSDMVIAYMNSDIVKVVTQVLCKYSGFNSDVVAQNIPKIDFTKKMTSDEINDYFGLTKDEVKLLKKLC